MCFPFRLSKLFAAIGLVAAGAAVLGPLVLQSFAATATITCSVTGSSIAGANNSRAMTLTDADLQRVLSWMNAEHLQIIADKYNGGVTAGFVPTVPQTEWGWFQLTVVNGTTQAEQKYGTTPAQPPPPIAIN